MTKVRTVNVRQAGRATQVNLTGLLLPGEYIAREVTVNHKPAVLIYEFEEKTCAICGEECVTDVVSDICSKCEEHLNNMGSI